ncbi:MAG: hypothetical protein O2816_08510 [Planctomycetota bacterium]|nr:hypothetical protein [Planctomycetota bacterium]
MAASLLRPRESEAPKVEGLNDLAPGELDYGGPIGYVKRGRSLRLSIPGGAWLPGREKLMLLALVGAVLWVWRSWEREVPLEARDDQRVLTAEQVAQYAAFEVQADAARLVRTSALLGTERLEYTYEKTGTDQPELRWVTEFRGSEGVAKDAYRWSTVETMTDWKLVGDDEMGLVELEEAQAWGDESKAFLVERNGYPIGNSFSARKGSTIVYLELRGVWIAEGWRLKEMLEPVLLGLE